MVNAGVTVVALTDGLQQIHREFQRRKTHLALVVLILTVLVGNLGMFLARKRSQA